MNEEPPSDDQVDRIFGADRAKAFIDAVVAIAMTLLILPLMEAITAIEADGQASAADWFGLHAMLLISFVVSFTVIATFWIGHHRMFAHVHRVTTGMLWLNMGWLITIVWLPVATAMSDEMSTGDALTVAVYVGSMTATSVLTLAQRLFLRARPQLHSLTAARMRSGIASDLAMVTLFLVSLVVAVLVPDISYFALFLLTLTGRLQIVYLWIMRRGTERATREDAGV